MVRRIAQDGARCSQGGMGNDWLSAKLQRICLRHKITDIASHQLCTVFLTRCSSFSKHELPRIERGCHCITHPCPEAKRWQRQCIPRVATFEPIPATSAAYRPAAQYERRPVKSFCRLTLCGWSNGPRRGTTLSHARAGPRRHRQIPDTERDSPPVTQDSP